MEATPDGRRRKLMGKTCFGRRPYVKTGQKCDKKHVGPRTETSGKHFGGNRMVSGIRHLTLKSKKAKKQGSQRTIEST